MAAVKEELHAAVQLMEAASASVKQVRPPRTACWGAVLCPPAAASLSRSALPDPRPLPLHLLRRWSRCATC